ncbi:hypothetical protein GmHk_05G013373 [Glycine max]|nr:hypothetical protein GmHk_05G013373 [Glycine max]
MHTTIQFWPRQTSRRKTPRLAAHPHVQPSATTLCPFFLCPTSPFSLPTFFSLTLSQTDTSLTPPNPRPNPPPPFKRLTSDEIAFRRERGLCFNCDEKYHRGHQCASRVFLLLAEDRDTIPIPDSPLITSLDPDPDPSFDPAHNPDPYPAQLSLNSMAGHLAPETLRFIATIASNNVVLLVDGGSTHNFIQLQLVTQLSLPCRTTTPLRVMVGNGHQLECNTICEEIPVTIQAHNFHVDLYVLPISGANVVLGVQWLKSLGPVLTDYNTLLMKFFHNGGLITLQGDMDASLTSLSSFRRLSQKPDNAMYYHITLLLDLNSATHLHFK